jgi:hypothetical protein
MQALVLSMLLLSVYMRVDAYTFETAKHFNDQVMACTMTALMRGVNRTTCDPDDHEARWAMHWFVGTRYPSWDDILQNPCFSRIRANTDPCNSHPCRNGGMCFGVGRTDMYSCQCVGPYYGPQCQDERIDHCASNPCRNGQRCWNNPYTNRFVCDCSEKFYGDRCEFTQVDFCAEQPCRDDQYCLNEPEGYTCEVTYRQEQENPPMASMKHAIRQTERRHRRPFANAKELLLLLAWVMIAGTLGVMVVDGGAVPCMYRLYTWTFRQCHKATVHAATDAPLPDAILQHIYDYAAEPLPALHCLVADPSHSPVSLSHTAWLVSMQQPCA